MGRRADFDIAADEGDCWQIGVRNATSDFAVAPVARQRGYLSNNNAGPPAELQLGKSCALVVDNT
jgi:hypothetical protein